MDAPVTVDAFVHALEERLGLLPVYLNAPESGLHADGYVLLNGQRGSFCLSSAPSEDTPQSVAWSSNVGHILHQEEEKVVVQRWDRHDYERYPLSTVFENLDAFYQYIHDDAPIQGQDIVGHALLSFRRIRRLLHKDQDGIRALKAFLGLLTQSADNRSVALPAYASERADIPDVEWDALVEAFQLHAPVPRLRPLVSLILRHAAGQLFQDAHMQIHAESAIQGHLPGLPAAPATLKGRPQGAIGLHFTPPVLARTLVEEALSGLKVANRPALHIFDPACGSGEFFRDALRQLEKAGFRGHLRITGWDISEAACTMARYLLKWEGATVPFRVTSRIVCRDSMSPDADWPTADVVLMNPPFQSVTTMSELLREQLRKHYPRMRGRFDLAQAFVMRAISAVDDGGVLGTIIPASILDSRSSKSLREMILSQLTPTFIGRFGGHHLFKTASVDAAAIVARRAQHSELRLAGPTMFWSDPTPGGFTQGIRQLRRARLVASESAFPIRDRQHRYSAFRSDLPLLSTSSWMPKPYGAWQLHVKTRGMPRVQRRFDVKQGTLTGSNEVFLMERRHLKELPPEEQTFFRPAVVNRSVKEGSLSDYMYVFFPYGDAAIETETDLADCVPTFFEGVLLPNKKVLSDRSDVKHWWKLTRPRSWAIDAGPKLVSTYFGGSGSFAWDAGGSYVVVQGYAWLMKPAEIKAAGDTVLVEALDRTTALAYLGLLNSSIVDELLSATASTVAGGQYNLSKRYVDRLALPDLVAGDVEPLLVERLTALGMRVHEGDLASVHKELRSLALAAYGLQHEDLDLTL